MVRIDSPVINAEVIRGLVSHLKARGVPLGANGMYEVALSEGAYLDLLKDAEIAGLLLTLCGEDQMAALNGTRFPILGCELKKIV